MQLLPRIKYIRLNDDKFKDIAQQEIRRIIEQEVCDFYEVPLYMIISKSKRRIYVAPRQVILFLLEYYTDWSQKQIGSYYGGRDHSTVNHARQTIEDFLSHRTSTPDKEQLNIFFYQYGYKIIPELQKETSKAIAIDCYY